MIRLLFRWFKPQFIKMAFETQSKKQWLKDTEFAFIDSDGRRYYRFIDDMNIPIMRKGHIERLLVELNAKLSWSELNLFIDAMKKRIDDITNSNAIKGRIQGLAHISLLVEEMSNRQKLILHPELLFEIAAATYIREDEDPTQIDIEIEKQKVEQFKKDTAKGGGLYDFFYKAGLNEFMPTFKELKENFTEYMEEAKTIIAMQEKYLTSILEEDLKKTEKMS